MSKWVRGIYNAAANFNMSRSLRAAAGRILDRDNEHMREEHIESNKRDKSCKSSESCGTTTACSTATFAACGTAASGSCSAACCSDSSCACNTFTATAYSSAEPSRVSTSSAKGESISSRVRASNEPRSIKQANSTTTDAIEHCTGIPTGVTV